MTQEEKILIFERLTGTKWNGGLYIGNLNLAYLEEDIELPDGLRVHRDLEVLGCGGFVKIPDDITVGRDFTVWDCEKFSQLPDGFVVGRDLDVRIGSRIANFPADLIVGRQILTDAESLAVRDCGRHRRTLTACWNGTRYICCIGCFSGDEAECLDKIAEVYGQSTEGREYMEKIRLVFEKARRMFPH